MNEQRPDHVRTANLVPYAFGSAGAVALPGPVLIGLLGDLGVAPASAKSTLHRQLAAGEMKKERHGRLGVYRLSGRLEQRFNAIVQGTHLHENAPWDRTFHTIIHDIPETNRAVRERLRTAALTMGYGQLRPGVLICPQDRAREVLSQAAIPDDVFSMTGVWRPADVQQVAARAWDLIGIRQRYLDTMAAITAALPDSTPADAASLPLLVSLANQAITARYADPELPAELLPADWPAERLKALLEEVFETVGDSARAYRLAQIAASPYASFVEYSPGVLEEPCAAEAG